MLLKRILTACAVSVLLIASVARVEASPDRHARQAFFAGREDIEAHKWAQAVEKFDRAIEILGERKQRILPPLISALFRSKQYARAREEIEHYLALEPDPDLAEYREIKGVRSSVRERAAEQGRRYRKAKGSSVIACNEYLEKHPHGARADEIRDHRERLNDSIRDEMERQHWQGALNRDSIRGYARYLGACSDIPACSDGRHAAEARRRLEILERGDKPDWR